MRYTKCGSKKSCRFNNNLTPSFRNERVFNGLLVLRRVRIPLVVMFEIVLFMYLCCTNLTETKIFNAGYWVLSENRKNELPAREPICPNRKNYFCD